jgi:hypothetical protein
LTAKLLPEQSPPANITAESQKALVPSFPFFPQFITEIPFRPKPGMKPESLLPLR